MAIFNGKGIKGSIGDVSFRKIDKNTITVQSNPGRGNVKQTANTKKSASLYGSFISPFAKHIRHNMDKLVNGLADRNMVNRMNSAIATIVNQHLEYDGTIVFNASSFNRLVGFEFNVNSPLVDSLLLLPTITYEDGKVRLTFPSFRVIKHIKFPDQMYKVQLQLRPVFFKLDKGLALRGEPSYLTLDKYQDLSEETSFVYDFPAGTVCIIGLGLLFTAHHGATANQKDFNPAGICVASYKDGIAGDLEEAYWYRTGFSMAKYDEHRLKLLSLTKHIDL